MGIILPRSWLRFWGLVKGQELVVVGDSVLVVVPPDHPKRSELLAALKRGLVDGFRS